VREGRTGGERGEVGVGSLSGRCGRVEGGWAVGGVVPRLAPTGLIW
jgi:hypothetical protein